MPSVPYRSVTNVAGKRSPGRPRAFDPEAALDCAVELFWAEGFDGVDVARIARAAGVTKPSLYRLFGDKASLFLHALERYHETVGVPPLAAFNAEPQIADAVRALLEGSVLPSTAEGRPTGCLVACVATGEAGQSARIREAIMLKLDLLTDRVAGRFEAEMRDGRLSAATSARARSRLVVDLMQGLVLRARAGASREDLLQDARNHVAFVLA